MTDEAIESCFRPEEKEQANFDLSSAEVIVDLTHQIGTDRSNEDDEEVPRSLVFDRKCPGHAPNPSNPWHPRNPDTLTHGGQTERGFHSG